LSGAAWPVVLSAGPHGLDPTTAERLAKHLRSGGVVIYPTETLYGLGALVEHEGGLRRVLDLKGRDESRPIPLLVPDARNPAGLELDPMARTLARAFWPGPLTLILDDPDRRFPPGVRSADGGVGVRVSSGPIAAALVSALGGPVTATSANRAGEAAATDLESALEVARRLAPARGATEPSGHDEIWVLDGGTLPASAPSTVVDCRDGTPRILREGAVPEARILAALSGSPTRRSEGVEEPFRVVFVCSGNTCRSPLASVLARQLLEAEGSGHRFSISSAGTGAWPGSPASEGSARAAARHGLDLADHRSAPLDAERVREADLILVMSPHHLAAAEGLGGAGKTQLLAAFARGSEDPLDGDPVRDPFGGDDEVYEATFRELEDLVGRAVRRLRGAAPEPSPSGPEGR
jgi:tRNA threonylcarbamoyl adenosine modification protein (Sua5/YciO/YrdC/YwlC family)